MERSIMCALYAIFGIMLLVEGAPVTETSLPALADSTTESPVRPVTLKLSESVVSLMPEGNNQIDAKRSFLDIAQVPAEGTTESSENTFSTTARASDSVSQQPTSTFTTSENTQNEQSTSNFQDGSHHAVHRRIIRSLTTEAPDNEGTTDSGVPEPKLDSGVLEVVFDSTKWLEAKVISAFYSLLAEISLPSTTEFRDDIAFASRPRLPLGMEEDAQKCRNIQVTLESIERLMKDFIPYTNQPSFYDVTSQLYSVRFHIRRLVTIQENLTFEKKSDVSTSTIEQIYTLRALTFQLGITMEVLRSLQKC